jgi:hypothetical protein
MFDTHTYATTIYEWGDEKGVVHFTDEYKKVPPVSRDRANIVEEAKRDVYGPDYWSRQLEEATSNYERIREDLLKEGERLIWHRYGSKTQYQMFTAGLPSIIERLETYRDQMLEAKAMLDKFAKENERSVSMGNEEAETDLYGRDKTWWRERVRPWKEQLEEATQNYEKAFDAFVKRVEGLGPFMFGRLSLTQYQMISSRLSELSDRMAEYHTQISEAKGMLSKLSKEAAETNADPAWLE